MTTTNTLITLSNEDEEFLLQQLIVDNYEEEQQQLPTAASLSPKDDGAAMNFDEEIDLFDWDINDDDNGSIIAVNNLVEQQYPSTEKSCRQEFQTPSPREVADVSSQTRTGSDIKESNKEIDDLVTVRIDKSIISPQNNNNNNNNNNSVPSLNSDDEFSCWSGPVEPSLLFSEKRDISFVSLSSVFPWSRSTTTAVDADEDVTTAAVLTPDGCMDLIEPVPLCNIIQRHEDTGNNDSNVEPSKLLQHHPPIVLTSSATPTLLPTSCQHSATQHIADITDESVQSDHENTASLSDSASISSNYTSTSSSNNSRTTNSSFTSRETKSDVSSTSSSLSSKDDVLVLSSPASSVSTKGCTTTKNIELDPSKPIDEAKRRRAIRKEIMLSKKSSNPSMASGVAIFSPLSSLTTLNENEETKTDDSLPDMSEIAQLLLNDVIMNDSDNKERSSSLLSTPTVAKQQHCNSVSPSSSKTLKTSDKLSIVDEHNKSNKKRRASKKSTHDKTSCLKDDVRGSTIARNKQGKTEFQHDNENSNKESVETASSTTIDKPCPEHLADLPTGTDPESRKQRRLMRNRLSAALHRKRKRETIDTQKKVIDEKDDEIAKLTEELQKMTLNYEEVKADFDIIVHHYGYSEIKTILAANQDDRSSPSSLSEKEVELVSDSNSSNDDSLSDVQGTNESTSFVSVTTKKTMLESHVMLPPYANKKKKTRFAQTIPATAMATMAMCAVLGCVFLPSSVFKLIDPDGSGLDAANGIVSSDYGSDARRRLDEAISPDEMTSLITTRNNKLWSSSLKQQVAAPPPYYEASDSSRRPVLISPIESQPNLWRYDSITGSPWSADHSVTLFDIFASDTDNEGPSSPIVTTTMKPPSLPPYLSHLSLPSSIKGTTDEDITSNTFVVVTDAIEKTNNLRGSLNRGMGSKSTLQRHEEFYSQDKSLDLFRQQRRRRQNVSSSVVTNGKNYMFCPKAYGSFQSGFMKLMQGIDGLSSPTNADPSLSQKVPESDLHKSKDELKCDMIVDFDSDDDDDDEDYMISDEIFKDAIEEEEENLVYDDKGLVLPKDDAIMENQPIEFPFVATHTQENEDDCHDTVNESEDGPSIESDLIASAPSAPYMSILVPASTLTSNWGGRGNTSDFVEPPSAWVELGCQVLSAKLINGVHFVEEGDDNGDLALEDQNNGGSSLPSPLITQAGFYTANSEIL